MAVDGQQLNGCVGGGSVACCSVSKRAGECDEETGCSANREVVEAAAPEQDGEEEEGLRGFRHVVC